MSSSIGENVKSTTRVVVTMPNFNGGRYLRFSIESVLNQSFRDFRFILVDNCSTDNSLKIIESFNDDRMTVHRNESHQSQSQNFNTCARLAASSEYCSIMHSDDIYEKSYLGEMVGGMEQNPDAMVAHCDFNVIDLQGMEKRDFKFNLKRKFLNADGMSFLKRQPEEELALLMRGDYIICPSVLYRTDIFNRIGYFNESYLGVEDWDLYLRVLLARQKIMYVPKKLFRYRVHPFNVTTHNRQQLIKYQENMTLLKKTLREARKNDIRLNCTEEDIEKSTLKILLWDLKEDLLDHRLGDAEKKFVFAKENIKGFGGSPYSRLIAPLIKGGLLGGVILDLIAKTYFLFQPASKTPV